MCRRRKNCKTSHDRRWVLTISDVKWNTWKYYRLSTVSSPTVCPIQQHKTHNPVIIQSVKCQMIVKYVQTDVVWLLVFKLFNFWLMLFQTLKYVKVYSILFFLIKSPSWLLACLTDSLKKTLKLSFFIIIKHDQISGNLFGTCNIFIHYIWCQTAVWLFTWDQLCFSFLDFYFISHLRKPGEPVTDLLHLISILCTKVKVQSWTLLCYFKV